MNNCEEISLGNFIEIAIASPKVSNKVRSRAANCATSINPTLKKLSANNQTFVIPSASVSAGSNAFCGM